MLKKKFHRQKKVFSPCTHVRVCGPSFELCYIRSNTATMIDLIRYMNIEEGTSSNYMYMYL